MKALETAANYLAADTENTMAEQVALIVAHPQQNDLIDHVDGVTVWEKVEHSFTCKEFLESIGYLQPYHVTVNWCTTAGNPATKTATVMAQNESMALTHLTEVVRLYRRCMKINGGSAVKASK